MDEVHYSERYDMQASLIRPWKMPGGKNFLIRILLWAAALMLLNFFFFGRGVLTAYMDLMRDVVALEALGEAASEAEITKIFSSLVKLYSALFFVTIIAWLINVATETALHKNVFRGVDHGLFPLRFGRDEGRVMLTQFVVFLSFLALYFGGIILITLFIAVGALLGTAGAALFGLLGGVGFIALFVLIFMLYVRLAPAAAYGVKHDRLVIFEMWKRVKGQSWNVFASYLIVGISGYIVLMIMMFSGMFIVFGNIEASGLLIGDVPEDPDVLFSAMAETFNKTSVKISLGLFMIAYVIGQLLYALHFWGVGNYTAEFISEKELD